MVLPGLHIKVMDFGIARIESAAFTQIGTLLGTPTFDLELAFEPAASTGSSEPRSASR